MSVTLSHAEPSIAGIGDYIALMKPRVMSLVVFTAFVGLVIAPGHVHPVIAVTALICIAVGAGAAGALNMWHDADIDARMARTQSRPVPAGRVAPGEALAFGLTLSGFAVVTLGLLVNVVAGALLAATIAFYVLIYTMWLKRRTPQNIVIGGAARAPPPENGRAFRARRCAGDDRLGFGDRRLRGRAHAALSHHLFLDAAPLLGAVTLSRPGLCTRWHSHAAGGLRRSRNAPADSALFAHPGAARRLAVASWLCGAALRDRRGRGPRGHERAGAAHLSKPGAGEREGRRSGRRTTAGARRQQADVRLFDSLSVPVVCHVAGRPARGPAIRPCGRMTPPHDKSPHDN